MSYITINGILFRSYREAMKTLNLEVKDVRRIMRQNHIDCPNAIIKLAGEDKIQSFTDDYTFVKVCHKTIASFSSAERKFFMKEFAMKEMRDIWEEKESKKVKTKKGTAAPRWSQTELEYVKKNSRMSNREMSELLEKYFGNHRSRAAVCQKRIELRKKGIA